MPEIPLTRRPLLAALLLLAFALPRPARADDLSNPDSNSAPTVGSSDQPYDPAADANGDGTVTKREARRYRRSQRGGVKKSAAAAAADDGSAAAAAGAHGAAALGAASSDASALKNSLPSADAGNMPGGPGGSKGFAGGTGGTMGGGPGVKGGGSVSVASPGGAGANASSGDPSNPKSPADFALAARSGYAPAFASAGLKLSADGRTVVRLDGSPATADDLARLRRGILEMPAALTRRPDFFAQISPQHYADLKSGYSQHPEMSRTVYKDVGETPDARDFVHTESCAKVSGDCNASVEKSSYKKGDFVAPEDLDRMWDALQKQIDATVADAQRQDQAENGGGGDGVHAPKIALAEDGSLAFDGGKASGGGASAVSASGGAAKAAGAPATAAAATAKRAWTATAAAFGFGGPGGTGRPSGVVLVLCALGALGTFGLAVALFRKR